MYSFKDKNGQTWDVVIDLPQAKRVRDLAKVDLLRTDLLALAGDAIQLVDVIYVLCKQQADARSLSDEQFAVALSSGEAIDEATEAFLQELTDFFPKARKATARQALAKLRELDTKVRTAATQTIEGLDVDALMAQAMKAMSTTGQFATSSPASSALTH